MGAIWAGALVLGLLLLFGGKKKAGKKKKRKKKDGEKDSNGWIAIVIIGVVFAAAGGSGTAKTVTHAITVRATSNSNEALANQMAARYGWTGAQATCLDELWNHESGFDAYAANPTSDARGIPQNINGWSADYQPGNAGQQIAWGLNYISGRYGTPCAAWDFEISHVPNWY